LDRKKKTMGLGLGRSEGGDNGHVVSGQEKHSEHCGGETNQSPLHCFSQYSCHIPMDITENLHRNADSHFSMWDKLLVHKFHNFLEQ
jgi:hypothetical protein